MPGSYTLELELFGVYVTDMPGFEIWADGALEPPTYSISSAGSSISITVNYGGALPTSLEFRFNDALPEVGRTIEVRSVKINDMYVNTTNYLSSDSLVNGGNATVDVTTSDFIFDPSDPPLSEFTTSPTRTLTAGADTVRAYSGSTDEVFDALGGRDFIYLGSGNDKVFGNSGDDVIYGGAGTDLISGGDDNDRIYGQDGNDELYGGNGNDRIHGHDGDDEIHGGAGDDRLNGHNDNDTITGGTGNDRLNGGNGNDVLYGGDDADTLTGGNGIDTLDGGNGDDLAYGGNGADILNGGDGADTLVGGNGDDVIHGDDGDDTIYGQADNDTIYGGAGADTILGGTGTDALDGGTENDVLVGGAGADTLEGGAGNDILHGHGLTTTEIKTILNANPGVVFNANTNSFYQFVDGPTTWAAAEAAASAATLNGVAGHHVVITSAIENEFIYQMGVTNGNDSSTGASGNRIWLGATDTVTVDQEWFWQGGIEHGVQFSNAGTSVNNFYENWGGGQPNNSGGAQVYGTMWFNGGGNDDTWDDRNATDGHDYVIEWDAGLMNTDNAIDIINGGAGSDIIYGYGGNDIINGGADGDVLIGGRGNDTLNGGTGNDAIYGGYGTTGSNNGNDTINGGVGDDYLHAGAGTDIVNGDDGDDIIIGDGGNDTIDGGADNDSITGGNGNDVIDGGTGNDIIDAGAQSDTVNGEAGDDVITGGLGVDTLDGGADNDTFNLANNDFVVGESITGGTGTDEIILTNATTVDFSTGTIATVETLTGSADDDDVTYTIQQALAFTTIDLAGGTDSSRVNITGTVDVTALGTPTVSNAENGFLTGSAGIDDLTISGAQLNALIYGGGIIDFDTGADVLQITSTSTTLNTLGLTDGSIVGIETIDARGASTGVILNLSGQTEDFIIQGDTGTTFTADTITGGSGDDNIRGNQGDDIIDGGAGDDIINGGDQDDTITGGTGVDDIRGGDKDDVINLANGDFGVGESIDGGADTDELILTNATTVDFTTGTLANLETLTGSAGNDDVTYTIQQALAFTTIDLAGGTDSSRVNITGTVDVTALGTPTVSNAENGYLTGSTGNDNLTITGAQLNALIYGGGTIDFDTGTDVLNLTSTSVDLNTLGGTDASVLGVETISASTAGAGVTIDMVGQTEAFTITGSGFSDILGSGSAADTINGGAGDDFILSFTGADIIDGGADNDTIYLLNGDFAVGESITGGAGTDTIELQNATTVDFTTGALATLETLIGSAGNDTVTISAAQLVEFTTANLAGGTDILNTQGTSDITASTIPTLSNIETGNVTGTTGADTFTVTGAQLDTLLIGAGIIDFDTGADILNITATSADLNTLGATDGSILGLETISASTAAADVTIDVSGQTEDFSLTGSANNDTITGGEGDDTINGGNGINTLYGGVGSDVITGGTGVDTIYALNATDDDDADSLETNIVNGGDGNDIIYGSTGTDTLNGDDGDDTIYAGIITTGNTDTLIAAGTDDAEEVIATGVVEVTGSTDLEMVNEEFEGDQIVGMRWQNLNIAQGSIITNAYIEFQADESDSSTVSLTFHGEDIDSSSAFTTTNSDISSRTTTSSSVSWNNVEAWESGEFYQTPDLSSVIQEIVDRGGWTSGSSDLSIIVSGTAGGTRISEAYEGDSMQPRLVVEYASGALNTTTMNGGNGDDILYGSGGEDVLNGDANDDIINGGDSDDTLNGGADNDILVGGDGDDTLNGDAGNDVLHGSGLNYTEIQSILTANPTVVFNAETNSFYEYIATKDTWANSNTSAIGSTLSGAAGHLAVITSQIENDYVLSLLGNDVWLGGSDAGTEGVWEWDAAGAQEDGVQFWSGDDTGNAVNSAYTNFDAKHPDAKKADDDYLIMDNKDGEWKNERATKTASSVIEWEAGIISDDNSVDTLNGGAGDDHLYGYGGDDTLNGGDDDDILFGGAGDDTMNGDAGVDVLIGDSGNDVMDGGSGDDVLRSGSTLGTSGTINTVLSGSANDAEEIISSGNMESLTSSDLELGRESSGTQLVGMRWENLNIGQGAVISRAYIEFDADESDSSTITLTFSAEANHDPDEFTTTNSDISDRTPTTETVDWHNVESWTTGNLYQTPDISTLVQAVVDRGGWVSGEGDLVILAERTAGASTAARVAESSSGGGTAPRLVIEYVENKTILDGGTDNDDLYGSSGMDVFVFESAGAANLDVVYDFDVGVDQIDLSALLTGYDPATEDITDFIQITDSGGDSDVRVDTTGSASFGAGTVVATIDGVTGLTDEAALVKSADILV